MPDQECLPPHILLGARLAKLVGDPEQPSFAGTRWLCGDGSERVVRVLDPPAGSGGRALSTPTRLKSLIANPVPDLSHAGTRSILLARLCRLARADLAWFHPATFSEGPDTRWGATLHRYRPGGDAAVRRAFDMEAGMHGGEALVSLWEMFVDRGPL